MVTTPKNTDAHLASAWTAGIAMLFLGIGLQGATESLVPALRTEVAQIDVGDEVMVEEFEAPAATEEQEVAEETELEEPVEEFEIPPLPEIAAPLTPPEMVELTELEQIVESPPTPVKPPEAKPAPKPRPVARTAPPSARPKSTSGGSGPPQLFTGGGGRGGRFPSPYYPASARSAGLQGSLRLLVTVEPSGLPSAVNVSSSSGHSALDSAARDHVQRRWRWPSGEVRRYIVPVKFVLQ
jgi:protein TonB